MSWLIKLFKRRLDRTYVSDVDTFLANYNTEHPEPSRSQRKIIEKYQRIIKRRDNAVNENADKDIL